ncbi:MAG TPA: NADPH-dependent FMN reductase [Pyrinomonadaceae bacterium]|nr:NADPH-dependent FMN reductase [Pyrinomonadaceae bacterium]
MENLSILGFVGSLRRASYNRGLMRAAQQLLPEGVSLTVADIGGLPLFNEDLEGDVPAEVVTLKRQVREADAILFATPEYNYSVPGVLKNAIDWASRPYGDNSFDGKPAAIMGASVGMLGTARAQYHLRQIFVFLNMHPLNQPEIMVPFASKNFDADGNLTNEQSKELISQMLQSLAEWTRRLRGRA